jgi:hypothetical protein
MDQYQAYQAEYVAAADKIADRAKLDMFKSQRMYRYIEFLLKKKYNNEVEIALPKSKKAYMELIKSFGTPVTLAITADGKDVICLLLDEM